MEKRQVMEALEAQQINKLFQDSTTRTKLPKLSHYLFTTLAQIVSKINMINKPTSRTTHYLCRLIFCKIKTLFMFYPTRLIFSNQIPIDPTSPTIKGCQGFSSSVQELPPCAYTHILSSNDRVLFTLQ